MQKSDSIGALAAALAKAQGAMQAAKKDSSNPYFKSKYADLAAVVEAAKKPLADNGLAFAQGAEMDHVTGCIELETLLMHESGEWISSVTRMTPAKADPQGLGSCITYARRYGLQALLGVPADDDDGNAATGADREVEVNKANPVKETTASQRYHTRPADSPKPAPQPAPQPAPEQPPTDPEQTLMGRINSTVVSDGFDRQAAMKKAAERLTKAELDLDGRRDALIWLQARFDGEKLTRENVAEKVNARILACLVNGLTEEEIRMLRAKAQGV